MLQLPKFDLKFKRNRPDEIIATDVFVIASYTLDRNYVGSYTLAGIPSEDRKILPLGYVLALDPSSGKVVPHNTSYGFEQVGILLDDADAEDADPVVNLLWRGDVFQENLWDNGDFGGVLQATKAALIDRIAFVKEDRLTKW